MFDPDSLQGNSFVPPVHLTSFSIFSKPVAIAAGSFLPKNINEINEITLSYLESVISFEFAALNFVDSDRNQYAYRMEGFDMDWNYVGYVGTEKKATYTNLDPGTYTFRVKASNNDGLWNEEGRAIALVITPPYWQTWWFRALGLLTIIGSAVSFYRVRMNAVKAQKVQLEKLVSEKTADLQQANGALTERQEEILQQQEEMKAQAELLQQINGSLQQSQEEISQQRDNLKIVNDQVMSSIQYAQTIQKAILPSG